MTHQTKSSRRWPAVLGTALLFLLSLLAVTVLWGARHFGHVSMASILYTLTTPLEGTDPTLIRSYLATAGVLVPVFAGAAAVLHKKKLRLPRWVWGTACAGLLALSVGVSQQYFGFVSYLRQQLFPSSFFEESYVPPEEVPLTFPERKRNLVYILMESCETSLMDEASGGIFPVNYIPELTALAEENVSFSQTEGLVGADSRSSNWTAAGMMAEFFGLPLNVPKQADGSLLFEQFFPGATGLGDILEEAGYRNVFLLGSNARFGDRDKMMSRHGSYEILDYPAAIDRGWIPPDYQVFWGYEDRKLFQFAREQLTELARSEQPFNLTLLTVDTHFPDGYRCPLCPDTYESQYANVWACASRQVSDFVEWLREQPFYENTTVVIAGDHCSMAPDFYLGQDVRTRRVYNCILNAPKEPAREKNRVFSTMDLFPTTLSALGVDIPGGRLALGTDLFSGEATLSEQLGPEELNNKVFEQSDYYQNVLYARGGA